MFAGQNHLCTLVEAFWGTIVRNLLKFESGGSVLTRCVALKMWLFSFYA